MIPIRTLLLLLLTTSMCHDVFAQQNASHPVSNMQNASIEQSNLSNGLIKVFQENKWYLKKSEVLFSPGYDHIGQFTNDVAPVSNAGLWGYVDVNGKEIVKPIYEVALPFKNGSAAVLRQGKWQLINYSGVETQVKNFTQLLPWFEREVAEAAVNAAFSTKPAASNVTSKLQLADQTASPAYCPPNITFEQGNLQYWSTFTGDVEAFGITNKITVAPSSVIYGRHTLIRKTTPSRIDPYGFFPMNPPDGSNNAILVGNDINGAEAERVSYSIQVPNPATDFGITFQYAVVFEDPGHEIYEQPRFKVQIYDQSTKAYINCSLYEFIATSGLPGFKNSPVDPNIKYKEWSSVYVNLSGYAGKNLILEFTTADCTLGGHWGYAYLDVEQCSKKVTALNSCVPSSTSLNGPTGFQQYKWWNDNFTKLLSTSAQGTINPGIPENSKVWLEVIPYNGFGCRDTFSATVAIDYPIADAGVDKSLCAGTSVLIGSPAVAGNLYQWSPASGLSSPTSSNPTATPAATTQYTLTVTASNGCTATATTTLNTIALPKAVFNVSANQCLLNNSFQFNSSNTSGATSFKWDFGDGSGSTASNPQHSYVAAGSYKVMLTVLNVIGCTDTASSVVRVYQQPNSQFTINTSVQCQDKNLFYFSSLATQTGAVSGSYWNFGDGNFSTNGAASHVYSKAGVYDVTFAVVNADGCVDTTTKQVKVVATPLLALTTKSISACAGSSIQLKAAGAKNYQWSPSTGLSCTTCPDPLVIARQSINYTVSAYDEVGCSVQDTVRVSVAQPIKISVNSGSVCTGLSMVLNASGAASYNWSPSAGLSNTTSAQLVAKPSASTTYRVVGYDKDGCFTDTAYALVTVLPRPSIELGPDLVLPVGTVYTLKPISSGDVATWAWSPSTNLSCSSCAMPDASVKGDVIYSLKATNTYGCASVANISIKSFCEASQVFIPNAFTPDGDGVNDILMIRGKGLGLVRSFRIFNRWGELVFAAANVSANEPAYGWDGKIKGVVAPPDVFVYTAEVLCVNGESFHFQGNVSILK